MDLSTGKIHRVDNQQQLDELKASMAVEGHKLEQLNSFADPECKRCHGRGHVGRNVVTGNYVPCLCCKK